MRVETTAHPAVVVTGAAGGIGAACVARFASAGHPVVALDHGRPGAPPGVLTMDVDVGDAEAVADAAHLAQERVGPVGAVVCAAGVLHPGDLCDQDPAAVRSMVDVNLLGVLHCLQAFAPQLVGTRGSAITIASNAAGVPRRGIGAYGATKAAATMLTLSMGLELARHGVRCNVVQPGSTDTPMLRDLWGSDPAAAQRARAATVGGDLEQYRLGIPLGRIAAPDDVAGVVFALTGADFAHVTMQEIYVDGGASLHA